MHLFCGVCQSVMSCNTGVSISWLISVHICTEGGIKSYSSKIIGFVCTEFSLFSSICSFFSIIDNDLRALGEHFNIVLQVTYVSTCVSVNFSLRN